MGFPRFKEHENVIDYKESKRILKLQEIQDALLHIGIDPVIVKQLSLFLYQIQSVTKYLLGSKTK